ncbi:MAG TPA: hypothetical protein VMB51_13040 [Solirubrobacteraceae bacterium]|nr:hypothetical protein [Solirubrobacteraceae bacterium]
MKFHARLSLFAPVLGAILFALANWAPGAQASFGVESFFAANCNAEHEGCKKPANPAEEKHLAEVEGYSQAGGHPPWGVTDFTVSSHSVVGPPGTVAPNGVVTNIRTDVAPGVSTNPEVVPKCSLADFGTEEFLEGTGAYLPPNCPESEIGTNKVVVVVEVAEGIFADVPLEGAVYNLEPENGLASEFGVALDLTPLGYTGLVAHTLIEGHVEWASDYHDYFKIKVSPALPLLSSRLVFKGNIGEGKGEFGSGGFLTNPTSCTGPGPQTTSTLMLESSEKATATATYTTPIGTENCGVLPFAPSFSLIPGSGETGSDAPDGVTAEATLPHDHSPEGLDSSQLKTATITLPEGMTMNPSAAHGLEACTPAQARIKSTTPGVACPEASKIGTVTLNVPGLPPESLQGNIYLGGPESGPITGPPYTMYVDAESARYGISVRLKASVVPNESTGRLTATFSENPEQPFSNIVMHLNGGALAPIANPLVCGAATTETSFAPFSGTAAVSPLVSPFTVDSNGSGGACASPLPFSPTQTTRNQPPSKAGAATSYALELERGSGQQYISQIKTTLPKGLVGLIPAVTQCGEPQAAQGECPGASQIGIVRVAAGAGPTPYTFSGNVYLTGPYNGAPFGLSIVVPAVAGPFNLGNVVTRGTITVNPYTAQVTATSTLPTIVKGVPLRLRKLTVEMNRQGFLINPTNCSTLATESTLTGFVPGVSGNASATLSSPFQVGECNKLAFKPTFKASTGAKTSKANGASLTTTITQPAGQANIKSVLVQLPSQLPSRLTTLQKACPEATFAVSPYQCPPGSFVGGATVTTPVLPGKMTGPAVLVSHGGAAFPDLDLILNDEGVRVILVGNTDIKKGITTTNFAAPPDVPVSEVSVNLPVGAHSALAANGNLCASKLVMPTTITGQNGVTIKQNTTITVSGCGVRIVGAKTIGNTAYMTVQTFAAGRISGKGSNLKTVFRHLKSAQKTASLKVPLSSSARFKRRPFKVKVRVGFVPKKKGAPTSSAYATVKFR